MHGTLKFYDETKKFGFITPDDPDFSDVFIHRDTLPNGLCAVEGLRLEFDIAAPIEERATKGKGGRAVNVRPTDG